MAIQQPNPNDPWATTPREAYNPQPRYVDPKAKVKKSSSGLFGQIIRWGLFFAMLAFAYHYFVNRIQP